MADLALMYVKVLLLISAKTWLLGVIWIIGGMAVTRILLGKKMTLHSVRQTVSSAAIWPLAMPKWSLIAWPFTFILYPLWLVCWFAIWPFFNEAADRRAVRSTPPDTVQA